jgi:hypothetical protein
MGSTGKSQGPDFEEFPLTAALDSVPLSIDARVRAARKTAAKVEQKLNAAEVAVQTLTSLCYVYAASTMLFGLGLAATYSYGDQAAATHFGPHFPMIPGWPLSVGAAFFFLGALQLWSLARRTAALIPAFYAASISWSIFSGFYLFETISARLYGPQVVFGALAVAGGIFTGYLRRTRRPRAG